MKRVLSADEIRFYSSRLANNCVCVRSLAVMMHVNMGTNDERTPLMLRISGLSLKHSRYDEKNVF
jgi:hypothetical protein